MSADAVRARIHYNRDEILIERVGGPLMTVDFDEARVLVDQILTLLAAYDRPNRVEPSAPTAAGGGPAAGASPPPAPAPG